MIPAVPAIGRGLTPAEVESYDMITGDLARQVRIVEIPALPGQYVGMTLGRYVLLAKRVPDDGSSTLLAHELVHVRQWAELGVAGFSGRYVLSFLAGLRANRRWMAAYHSIDAEEEARREATDWLRRRTRRQLEQDGSGYESASPGDGGER
jgi:hypothetical protein